MTISDIPFDDPIGACNIGLIDNELVVNPTYEELGESGLELTVAGTGDAIMMVEAGAQFVSESVLLEALELAQEVNGEIVDQLREMQREVGKPKWELPQVSTDEELTRESVRGLVGDRMKEALRLSGGKHDRESAISEIMSEVKSELASADAGHDSMHVQGELYSLEKEAVREGILDAERRPDGRGLSDLRPLESMVGYVPRVHGSSIFKRGETQVMGILTLAPASEAQRLDSLSPVTSKRFIHHYNFPPYSTGEAGRFGFTGRREVGHGTLAERALAAVVPDESEFPYTIRLVSEVLESNGSTSMGSVCAGTLAMMDGGVPIKAPVAGIAMGLITGPGGTAKVLTDIQGAEDHAGDMDFKVAGTREGVTALQMDIKVKGITFEVMREALEQARLARLEILDHMSMTMPESRDDLRDEAPRMTKVLIPKDKIGMLIGPGGATVKALQEEHGVHIDIGEEGEVVIGSSSREASEGAEEAIRRMTKDIEVGEVYVGKVVKIMDFGCFVNLVPGRDGMVHISELSEDRVPTVESVVSEGDRLEVMVVNVDQNGRVDLSARAMSGDYDGDNVRALEEAIARRGPGGRGGGGGRRNDRRGGGGGDRRQSRGGGRDGYRGRDRDGDRRGSYGDYDDGGRRSDRRGGYRDRDERGGGGYRDDRGGGGGRGRSRQGRRSVFNRGGDRDRD